MDIFIYIAVSVFLILVDACLGILCRKRKNLVGNALGCAAFIASLTGLFYLLSITTGKNSYTAASVFSSFYFLSIDYLLICLLFYVKFFARLDRLDLSRPERILWNFILYYSVIETVVFLINPFWEIAVSYTSIPGVLPTYKYNMKPLYIIHLVYTYFMVAYSVFLLIRKSFHVPYDYRASYFFFPIVVACIVLLNAIYLYIPDIGFFSRIDISIWLYDLAVLILYWHSFYLSKNSLLDKFKSTLFDSLGQGILLFDYTDELTLYNHQAQKLFPQAVLNSGIQVKDFFRKYVSNYPETIPEDSGSFICYANFQTSGSPLRCDHKKLVDRTGMTVGKFFVFTDLADRMDLLTGFVTWESFLHHHYEQDRDPVTVTACSISGLSIVNASQGHAAGDRMLKFLSEVIKENFPRDALFVRGKESSLLVISSLNEKDALTAARKIRSEFGIQMQYAVAVHGQAKRIEDTIANAEHGINNRKLLDRNSSRSSALNSLVIALKECDPDTEAHVTRTQAMGNALADRLHLSDIQKSDLTLLCLLHDIGKIGVPLEILNKPGQLTEEEISILKSHVDKGYNIAVSSSEFSEIADMIRSHHERWDGQGYPDGKVGEAIPILSRIISIIDSFDAMVNERSYKPGIPRKEALREITRCAGTQFDPHIVYEFLRMMDDNPDLGNTHSSIYGQSKMLQFPGMSANSDSSDIHQELTVRPLIQSSGKYPAQSLFFSCYHLDNTFQIVSADKNFEAITGYSPEDIQTGSLNQADLIPQKERADYFQQLSIQLSVSSTGFYRHSLVRKDKTICTVFCMGRRYYDSAARSQRSEIMISPFVQSFSIEDLTESDRLFLIRSLSEWENSNRRDPATRLLRISSFMSDLDIRLVVDSAVTILMLVRLDAPEGITLHSFERITAARLLAGEFSPNDLCTCLEDDEFAASVQFGKNKSAEDIMQYICNLKEALRKTIAGLNPELSLTIRYVLSDDKTANARELMDKARNT